MAAWQAWMLVAAAAAAAGALFLVKVRPPRVVVPTLLLWTRVLSDPREQTLWERIRRAVSLVLTIAIALALGFAATRPTRIRAATVTEPSRAGRVLVVLDSSLSMLAKTRGGERRWDRALAEARRIAAGGAGGEIAIATTTNGIVEGPTTDLAAIDAALDRLEPEGGAASGWPRLSGADVHFLTDGAVARPADPDVEVHSVYERADNAGILAFDIRPPLDGTTDDEAYLEIGNFGAAQNVRLVVTRGAVTLVDRRIDMPADQTLRQVLRLPRSGEPGVRARIEARHDALESDNEAFGWIDAADPIAVTIVGSQTNWLAPALASAGVRATFVSPADYRPGKADVLLFDRWAPEKAPTTPAVFIAPSGAPWLGSNGDRVEPRPQWTTAAAHPLLAGVDPLTFSIERARIYQPEQFAPIARSVAATPLLWTIDSPDRARQVVLAFGPADSNLAAAAAFPVLLGNALEWLARPAPAGARHLGHTTFDRSVTRLKGPRDSDVPLMDLPNERLAILREPGLYTASAASSRATFAVNIVNPDVSNLAKSVLSREQSAAVVGAGMSPRPWWVYLLALAFAAVLLEWWTWLRRITV